MRTIGWVALFGLLGATMAACAGGDGAGSSEDDLKQGTCGGRTWHPCKSGYYCEYPSGSCGAGDMTGVCKKVQPTLTCAAVHDPVCGCDGETYENSCDAKRSGQSIASKGECVIKVCGGFAGLTCDEGEYCNYDSGSCGAGDQSGVCEAVPDTCEDGGSAVCGCDGKSYPSACEAATAGVSVKASGSCSGTSTTTCGAHTGLSCKTGYYCEYLKGSCGADDKPGACKKVLPTLTCSSSQEPVCGCDGKTYDNACKATKAGVSIASDGKCGG